MTQNNNKSRYLSKNDRWLNEGGLSQKCSPLYGKRSRFDKNSPEGVIHVLTDTTCYSSDMGAAISIESNISVPLILGMFSAVSVAAQPAALPGGIVIAGRYFCSTDITGSGKSHSDVTLVYNAHTGNLTGLPANAARHSFGYNMGKLNIDRSKLGVFYWGADMRNKNYYPALSNTLFLLKNGDLATAKLSKVSGGTDYEVAKEDINDIVVFSKEHTVANLRNVALELGALASRIWGGNIFEESEIGR